MKEIYYDDEGRPHWPDASLGSEKYYPVDWTGFLVQENDTRSNVSWTVPTGLTNMDTTTDGNKVLVKLSADTVGTYEVICEIETVEDAFTQKFRQKMYLTVF